MNLFNNFKLTINSIVLQFFSGSILFLIIGARISIEEFGLLAYYLVIANLVSIVNDLGLTLMVQKDIPQSKRNNKNYLGDIYFIKLIISVLSILIALFFKEQYSDNSLFLIAILFGVVSSHVSLNQGVFRANNLYSTELKINFIYFLFGLFIILTHNNVYDIIFILLIGRCFQLFFQLFFVKQKELLKFKISLIKIYVFFKSIIPYASHYIAGIVLFSIDIILLENFGTENELGIYSFLIRVTAVIFMISEVILNVMIPYLSKLILVNKIIFKKNFQIFEKLNIVLSCLLFIVFIISYDYFNLLLFDGKYDTSTLIIFLIGLAIYLRLSVLPNSTLLTITGFQRIRSYLTFIALGLNLPIAILLISKYGILGTVITFLIINISVYILYSFAQIKFNYKYYNFLSLKGLFFCLSIGLIIITIKNYSNLVSLLFGLIFLIILILILFKNLIKLKKNKT